MKKLQSALLILFLSAAIGIVGCKDSEFGNGDIFFCEDVDIYRGAPIDITTNVSIFTPFYCYIEYQEEFNCTNLYMIRYIIDNSQTNIDHTNILLVSNYFSATYTPYRLNYPGCYYFEVYKDDFTPVARSGIIEAMH